MSEHIYNKIITYVFRFYIVGKTMGWCENNVRRKFHQIFGLLQNYVRQKFHQLLSLTKQYWATKTSSNIRFISKQCTMNVSSYIRFECDMFNPMTSILYHN